MPLAEYWRKRDFTRTPEPRGAGQAESPPTRGHRYVVQRHRATRLHYDFRLEVGDVLVSWAVPRGPTLDPGARRMAIHVEDHPQEYFEFEGVIPKGQYGGGDVIVWDWGTWEADPLTPDPKAAIDAGELKFHLNGEKLRGSFTIVRTRRSESGQDQWLLLHKRDEHAVAGWDAEDHPHSVRSGLTNDDVKANAPAIWVSAAPVADAEIDLSAAKPEPMPQFVQPMMATLASESFDSPDWLFEIKWDGFRVQAHVSDGRVRLLTRNGKDGRTYFPTLMTSANWINAQTAIVDGEVVALDARGRPDFNLLQERLAGTRASGLIFEAFDLLYWDGRSLHAVPLEERKKLLRLVLRGAAQVRFADHVLVEGRALMAAADAQGLEGIVAKRRDSAYLPGQRTSAWLKVKLRPSQELVVGGWTPSRNGKHDLGALVVGVYDDDKLRFAGKVGSGFDARARRELMGLLAELESKQPAFDPPPPPGMRGRWGGDLAGVTWVRPMLVVRAELGGWSRDGMVRQAAYKGVEPDRDPLGVRQEREVDPAEVGALDERDPKRGDRVIEKASAHRQQREVDAAPAERPGDRTASEWRVTKEELAGLDALETEGTWHVGDVAVKLSNLEKALFEGRPGTPDPPITKREVIRYFAGIAPAMLPHLAGRPLNLHRFPNGAGAPGFWQKDIPKSAPRWLTRWVEELPDETDADRKANTHLIADRAASLVWLANQASFEVHAWTSTLADPWRPTFALIDIDPGTETTWDETLTIARLFRTALDHLGVRAYAKTTGSRGIQAWIPLIAGKYDYRQTSDWVEALSRAVGAIVPELVSWEWSKKQRGGLARLDFTQNAPIKTLVAPYSVRPRAGAPVSMPIRWDELDDPGLRSDSWTIRDAIARVEQVGDLFAGAQTDHQELPNL